jgi:hypothetical protein
MLGGKQQQSTYQTSGCNQVHSKRWIYATGAGYITRSTALHGMAYDRQSITKHSVAVHFLQQ